MLSLAEIFTSRGAMEYTSTHIHSPANTVTDSNKMHDTFDAFIAKKSTNSSQNMLAHAILSYLKPLPDAPPINFEITKDDKDLVINRYTNKGVSILSIDTDGSVFISFTPYQGASRHGFYDHVEVQDVEQLAYAFMNQ